MGDDRGDRRMEPSGDPGHSDVDAPAVWLPPRMPADVQRFGLTRNTEEGALIEFAANLDRARPTHLAIAWVLLLVLFVIPALLTILAAIRS